MALGLKSLEIPAQTQRSISMVNNKNVASHCEQNTKPGHIYSQIR